MCRELVAAGAEPPSSYLLSCTALGWAPLDNSRELSRKQGLPLAGFFIFVVSFINDRPDAALVQMGMGNTWH